eukprot:1907334-Rhodomonas_salina.1
MPLDPPLALDAPAPKELLPQHMYAPHSSFADPPSFLAGGAAAGGQEALGSSSSNGERAVGPDL